MIELFGFIKAYWIEAIAMGSVGMLGFIVRKLWYLLKSEHEEEKIMKKGMLSILHDRIYQLCQKHITAAGITVTEMDNLKFLYDTYQALGGNGTAKALYERCQGLHLKQED